MPLLQPRFPNSVGGRIISFLRIAKSGDTSFVMKIANQNKKYGEIIARCRVEKKLIDDGSYEFITTCKIRPKAATDSDLFRPLNPEHSGHRFRFIPDTFCQIPESGINEAALDNLNGISHHVSSEKERRTRWQKRGYPCEK